MLGLLSARYVLLEAAVIELRIYLRLLIVAFLLKTGAAVGRIRLCDWPSTNLCHADAHRVELHLVASKRACLVREYVVKHAQVLYDAHVANFCLL